MRFWTAWSRGRRALPRGAERPAPDDSRLLVKRDRAILELLYASGLRVSELTGLNLADMDRKELMLRVRGKGNKERIVPYGGKAEQALEAYEPLREEILRKAGSTRRPAGRVSEPFWHAADAAVGGAHRQKIRASGQRELGFAPAFPAARICHASAGRRRGPSRDSGIAGPLFAFHHAAVHARHDSPIDGSFRQSAPARLNLIRGAGVPPAIFRSRQSSEVPTRRRRHKNAAPSQTLPGMAVVRCMVIGNLRLIFGGFRHGLARCFHSPPAKEKGQVPGAALAAAKRPDEQKKEDAPLQHAAPVRTQNILAAAERAASRTHPK